MNRFNWRPMTEAPRDGRRIVHMRVITHVGGWSRPIDITPEIHLLKCHRYSPDSLGYWMSVDQRKMRHSGMKPMEHSVWVNEAIEWWTSPEEYDAAIPEADWRRAPDDYIGIGPLIFVRPPQPRWDYDGDGTPKQYDAITVWGGTHNKGSWHSVRAHDPLRTCDSGYLDGFNVNGLPFRWCHLAEFFPQAVFDRMSETARNIHEYDQQRIARWRSLG